jgi:hypothetical protein
LGAGSRYEKRFKAKETGVLVRFLSGQGEVASVYSKALNIRHTERLLVSLVENTSQMTALSLSVPSLFGHLEAQKATVKPGDRVWFERHRWAINDIQIDLAEGETWEGSLTTNDIEGFCLSKISLLKRALLLKGKKGGLLGLIHPEEEKNLFVERASRMVGQTLIKGDEGAARKGLSQLVGLGVGFTPSGDDFIAGALLGEKILSLLSASCRKVPAMPKEPMAPYTIDKEEIREARDGTNDGGWTLLYQALQGHFPHYLVEAVKGLAGARHFEEMTGVVGGAASHGETSGTDALVGLWFYLAKLGNNHSDVV